jgi:hypothetical protein
VLKCITALPRQSFWPDEVAPTEAAALTALPWSATDADVLAMAEYHEDKLAATDAGIAPAILVHKDALGVEILSGEHE